MSTGDTLVLYLLVFMLCILAAVWSDRSKRPYGLIIVVLVLSAIAGFRAYEVGVDTAPYLESIFYQFETGKTDWQMTSFAEGYGEFTRLVLHVCTNATFLLCIEALITNGLIIARLWDFRDDASLAYMVFVYVLTAYLQTLCLTCQYLAIAIVFYSSRWLERKHPLIFLTAVIIAMQLHASAIIGFILIGIYIILYHANTPITLIFKYIAIPLLAIGAGIVVRRLINTYSNYLGNSSSVGFMVFIQLAVFLIFLLLSNMWQLFEIQTSALSTAIGNSVVAQKFVTISTALGILISIASYIVPNAGRIALYLTLFSCVFYAMAVRVLRGSSLQVLIIRIGLSIWFVLYFIYVFVFHDTIGVMNYSFI